MINPLEFFEREEVVNMSFIEIKGLSKIFLQGNQKNIWHSECKYIN